MTPTSSSPNKPRLITKGIVPAAGIGSRLYPITRSQPKEMLPLGRKPTIQWAAEELIQAGITSIVFVTGESKRALSDHFDPAAGPFGDNKTPRACGDLFEDRALRLLYIRQGGARGLADAILCGDTFAGDEDFVVSLGDVVVLAHDPSALVRRLCDIHLSRGAAATIAVNAVPEADTVKYGIVSPAADGGEGGGLALNDVIEKPPLGEAPSNLAITGRYVLAPIAFEYIRRLEPGFGGEYQLTDALRAMIHDGLPVYAEPLAADEHVLDIGDIPGYWRAFLRVALEDEVLGAEMRALAARILAENGEG